MTEFTAQRPASHRARTATATRAGGNTPGNCYINLVIKVLSCNLFSGRADPEALGALIDEHSVDIVCAQELSPAHARALQRRLPYGDLDHDQIIKGNGIAARRPVTSRRIHLPKRDAWEVTLTPEHWTPLQETVQVLNVHISAPHLWPYFPHPVRRGEQLRLLLQDRAAYANTPHAIFGDFNASPAWPVYRRMRARYTDGTSQTARNGAATATWPRIPRLGINGWWRIDHCFLWKLSALNVWRLAIAGSDHFALLAELHYEHPL